jgi:hypothetical protein
VKYIVVNCDEVMIVDNQCWVNIHADLVEGFKCSLILLKPWCVMDSKHNKCVPIVKWKQLRWLWCGVVCKVRIERFDRIPSTIELARKSLKMDDKQETCKQ